MVLNYYYSYYSLWSVGIKISVINPMISKPNKLSSNNEALSLNFDISNTSFFNM